MLYLEFEPTGSSAWDVLRPSGRIGRVSVQSRQLTFTPRAGRPVSGDEMSGVRAFMSMHQMQLKCLAGSKRK